MKNIFLLLITCITVSFSTPSNAQTGANISLNKMHVLYAGVDNPIQIETLDSNEVYKLIAPGLAFKATKSKYKFNVAPSRASSKKGIKIKLLDSKGNVVHVLHVRVKRLPNPVALVLGQRSGLMSKGKLKALSRVDAKIENFDFDVPVRVKSFDVMIFSEMDSLVKFSIKGNKITSEVKKQFLKVESGSYIVFDNIKVGLPGGARKVSSIVIRMK